MLNGLLASNQATAESPSVEKCNQIKTELNESNKPSQEALANAMRAYSVLTNKLFNCIYPDVIVVHNPIGEIENIDQWKSEKTVTLMDRKTFSWGKFEAVYAILNGSKGHDNIKVTPVGEANQFEIISFKNNN